MAIDVSVHEIDRETVTSSESTSWLKRRLSTRQQTPNQRQRVPSLFERLRSRPQLTQSNTEPLPTRSDDRGPKSQNSHMSSDSEETLEDDDVVVGCSLELSAHMTPNMTDRNKRLSIRQDVQNRWKMLLAPEGSSPAHWRREAVKQSAIWPAARRSV